MLYLHQKCFEIGSPEQGPKTPETKTHNTEQLLKNLQQEMEEQGDMGIEKIALSVVVSAKKVFSSLKMFGDNPDTIPLFLTGVQFLDDKINAILDKAAGKSEKARTIVEQLKGTNNARTSVDMTTVNSPMDVFKQMDKSWLKSTLGEVPLITLYSQMSLESGAKLSNLAKKYNNFFGIKYREGMAHAKPVEMSTKEDYGAGLQTVKEKFAHFDTPEDAFKAYAEKMMNPPEGKTTYYSWYQNLSKKMSNMYGVKHDGKWDFKEYDTPPAGGISLRSNPVVSIKAIKDSGYATDPNYVSKVVSVMKSNLTVFGNTTEEIEVGMAFVKSLGPIGNPTLKAYAKEKYQIA